MKSILFGLVIFLPIFAIAQKDAPVAGHAAILVDLLKKDYGSIDAETRQDELVKDRATVIAILKSYLTDHQTTILTSSSLAISAISLKVKLDTLNIKKKAVAVVVSIELPINGANVLRPAANTIEKLHRELEDKRKDYYGAQHSIDQLALENIQAQYNADNKFIARVIDLFKDKYKSINDDGIDKFSTINTSSSVQKSIPFIGGDMGFDVLVDGLSRFLAKRIKEELTNYVIERVQVWLENPTPEDPFAELKTILPRTTDYLIAFKADQVTNFPNEVKQYIETDLNNVLGNLPNLRNTPRLSRLVNQHPDLDFAFEAFELIPNLAKIKNPVDFFKLLDNSRNVTRWQTSTNEMQFNIANTIRLSSLLAQSLTIVDNGELRLAGIDFMETYITQPNFQLLYLGFLYQQSSKFYDIKFKTGKQMLLGTPTTSIPVLSLTGELGAIVGSTTATVTSTALLILNALPRVSANAEKITTEAMQIRKANKANMKVGADTIHQFVESMIDFTEELVTATDTVIQTLLAPKVITVGGATLRTAHIKEDMRTYFIFARSSNDIVLDQKQKKYADALITALELSGKLGLNPAITKISTSISRLGMLKRTENFKSWHVLVDSITNTPNSTFRMNSSSNEAAFIVYGELKKIERYDLEQNASAFPGMADLKTYIQGLTAVNSGTVLVDPRIKAMVNSLKFKELLISYYGGVALENLINEIKKEMTDAKFTNHAGVLTDIFSQEEIDRVNVLTVSYAHQIFDNYILDGRGDEGRDLIHGKEILLKTVQNTLTQLPQLFNKRAHPEILKLIHFVNEMAVAKDAEDVEKAIDAFALPSGSYSIKRTSKFNFSLNSFPGLILAAETSWTASQRSTAFSFSFTAPVGLSAAWGTLRGYSWGIFLPVIDIGAVTRLRLDSDSNSATLPELTFKNFLSPGLYLHFGLKKSPISFHVGAQFGPEVRRLGGSPANDTWESIRYGAGLVLDIPLLNLATIPRFRN